MQIPLYPFITRAKYLRLTFVKEHSFLFFICFLYGPHILGSEHHKVDIKIKIGGWVWLGKA